MAQRAPGKAHREGVSLIELHDMFPDEQTSEQWFEQVVWGEHRCCPHCGSTNTHETPNRKPSPYRCKDCRSYFSVKTGSAMSKSPIPYRKWAIAIYICLTSLKGVSSMKLHRDLKVTQKTAWFMLHRIREAWAGENGNGFSGPVEQDETYFGGIRKNMSKAQRKGLTGRGAKGKTAVVGMKDRASKQVAARVVEKTDAETLQGFLVDYLCGDATVYTDDATAYSGLPFDHETVRHSVGEYVRGEAHTNGIESFWSMLKRAHKGTFHKISPKHLNRYVQEFAGRHNARESDTVAQMCALAAGLVGRRLMYRDLVRDNGLDNAAA
ncbi:MAG: IS1595 family transposase [Gemmatimonadota bacterium]|nr:IS1595 family transposase [Gemmatimonadota bacterium]